MGKSSIGFSWGGGKNKINGHVLLVALQDICINTSVDQSVIISIADACGFFCVLL